MASVLLLACLPSRSVAMCRGSALQRCGVAARSRITVRSPYGCLKLGTQARCWPRSAAGAGAGVLEPEHWLVGRLLGSVASRGQSRAEDRAAEEQRAGQAGRQYSGWGWARYRYAELLVFCQSTVRYRAREQRDGVRSAI